MAGREDLEEIFLREDPGYRKVEALLPFAFGEDFFLRHKAYYLLKELKEQAAVPFLLERARTPGLPEGEMLRILDALSAFPQGVRELQWLLRHKNPYLVRGEVMALALAGGREALEILLGFAASPWGRMVRRELMAEALGYLLAKEPGLVERLEKLVETAPLIRGYLRDMELHPPAYGRLSVFPANDYWAIQARGQGLDYGEFKDGVETIHRKNKVRGI